MAHPAYPYVNPMYMPQMPVGGVEGRSLYVGNLDPKVTEGLLWEVFSTVGHVETCKLIKDRFGESSGYGFVDFYTREDAERGLLTLNGRKIYNKEIKVNWAAHATNKEDTTGHHNIFVGDLSSEINDEMLRKAFAPFGSVSEARVMWDQNTGRSRGYGFVAFRERSDAERAMTDMNGVWLGSRAIRCNWANQKTATGATIGMPGIPAQPLQPATGNSQTFDEIASLSSTNCTTVYIGNLAPEVSEDQLRQVFQGYGTIDEVRTQKDKSFGFVKYQTHDQATRAIIAANGTVVGGRPIRCSWGKEKSNQAQPSQQTQQQVPYGYYPYGQNYMYNMQGYPGYQYYQGQPGQYYSGNYDPYAEGYHGYPM